MSLFFEKSNPEKEVNKEIITAKEEHYDGSSMTDVYENYNSVRRDAHGDYVPVHFVETRKYLQKVRDLKRHIELLENRISYRTDAGLEVDKHESELEGLRQELMQLARLWAGSHTAVMSGGNAALALAFCRAVPVGSQRRRWAKAPCTRGSPSGIYSPKTLVY